MSQEGEKKDQPRYDYQLTDTDIAIEAIVTLDTGTKATTILVADGQAASVAEVADVVVEEVTPVLAVEELDVADDLILFHLSALFLPCGGTGLGTNGLGCVALSGQRRGGSDSVEEGSPEDSSDREAHG